jgi:hypothetical protein
LPNNQIYHRIKHPKLSEKKSRSRASDHHPANHRSATSIEDEAYPFGDSVARFHLLARDDRLLEDEHGTSLG